MGNFRPFFLPFFKTLETALERRFLQMASCRALLMRVLCFINEGTFSGQKKGLKPALERGILALSKKRLNILDIVDILAAAVFSFR